MAEEAAAAPSKGGSKGPMLVVLLNTLAVVAALGMFVYTKLLYHRPKITEHQERTKIAMQEQIAIKTSSAGNISFEPFTVNIRPNPSHPEVNPGDDMQIKGKLHYATVSLTIEVADLEKREKFDNLRPQFMDEILALLGKKAFNEITSVQGRYILRTQIAEIGNKLLQEPYITNVYFTQFIVQ